MKVLLIGEFSKVHNNLQYGLEQLGVTVDTINTGDGFKKFSSDIKQFQIAKDKKYDFIRNFYSKCLYEYIHRKYDVVQFIHELELGEKYGLERNLGARLAKNARLSVLLQAGCNWQYFKYAKKKMDRACVRGCVLFPTLCGSCPSGRILAGRAADRRGIGGCDGGVHRDGAIREKLPRPVISCQHYENYDKLFGGGKQQLR